MSLSLLDLLICTTKGLSNNLVRSSLSALGIFMGVAAVNVTLNINEISRAQIAQKLAARDNPFLVPQMSRIVGGQLEPAKDIPTQLDLIAMQREIGNIGGVSRVTQILGNTSIQYQEQMINNAEIFGVSETYQRTTGRQILQGRFFGKTDFVDYLPVVIIDQTLANQLFQGADPIGQGIYVMGTRFTVVGVAESKNNFSMDQPKGELWLTSNYGNALSGGFAYQAIQITLRQLEHYESTQEKVKQFLSQRYPSFNVEVYGNAEDLYKEDQQQRTSSLILLVVGLLGRVLKSGRESL
jgi:putative ABC transport system permease protein